MQATSEIGYCPAKHHCTAYAEHRRTAVSSGENDLRWIDGRVANRRTQDTERAPDVSVRTAGARNRAAALITARQLHRYRNACKARTFFLFIRQETHATAARGFFNDGFFGDGFGDGARAVLASSGSSVNVHATPRIAQLSQGVVSVHLPNGPESAHWLDSCRSGDQGAEHKPSSCDGGKNRTRYGPACRHARCSV